MPKAANIDAIVARIEDLDSGRRPILVGIDGRGGAGKSTLAIALAERIDGAGIVQMDDLYLSNAQRRSTGAGIGTNYDRKRLVEQVLAPLQAGRPARYQRYDWDLDVLAEWIELDGPRIVIIEGVTSIADDVASCYDFTIWVETPLETCLTRGIERDGESMRGQWEDVWLPGDEAYRAAQSPDARADIVVSGLRH